MDESNVVTSDGDILYVPLPVSTDDTDEHFELVLTEENKTANDVKSTCFEYRTHWIFNKISIFLVLNANVHSAKRKSDETFSMKGGNKYGYLKEIHTKHKIKRQKTNTEQSEGKID